jgi:hypothetical protein
MPLVGFEPTIPAFERAKTIHALDRAADVICWKISLHTVKHLNEIKYKRFLQNMFPLCEANICFSCQEWHTCHWF